MENFKHICVFTVFIAAGCCGLAYADLYVDSAPNNSNLTDWSAWWQQTKTDVAAGTFTDLRSIDNPNAGAYTVSPYDEIVYNTGDMGNRIQWIYWMPNESTTSLNDRFEVKWVIDFYGTNYTMDWSTNKWTVDSPEKGWTEPTNWENYNNGQGTTGVVGTFSFAWQANDNYAEPFSTDSNLFNETNQEDIRALAEVVLMYQTYATGYIRLRPTTDDEWVVIEILTVDVHAPLPAAVVLGLIGLGVAGYKLRKSS
jgi:hypothetical protein